VVPEGKDEGGRMKAEGRRLSKRRYFTLPPSYFILPLPPPVATVILKSHI
jgi:hypothetical protein